MPAGCFPQEVEQNMTLTQDHAFGLPSLQNYGPKQTSYKESGLIDLVIAVKKWTKLIHDSIWVGWVLEIGQISFDVSRHYRFHYNHTENLITILSSSFYVLTT